MADTAPLTGAAAPTDQLPRAIDPMLGEGSGTVSIATTSSGAPLEPMPAEVISERASRSGGRGGDRTETVGGRRVRNPHRPHVVRTAEQRHRSAGNARSGLGPVRDTGMTMMSRRERHELARKRRQGFGLAGFALVLVALLGAGMYWMELSDRQAAATDLTVSGLSASGIATDAGAPASSPDSLGSLGSLDASDTPTGAGTAALVSEATSIGVTVDSPTPLIGTCAGVDVFLPVSVRDLTEVGFHQANYTYAIPMATHMPIMKASEAQGVGTKRDKSIQRYGNGAKLVGSCVEMWRSGRDARQMTAADCGAPAGSIVFAPVTGTVTAVKTYTLEGKATDYEIHIAPDGAENVEVVVIHITNVVVRKGDHLLGGASPIARVMDTAKLVRNQLATYAGARGNHAHIQFNDTDSAAYIARHSE